MAISQIKNQNSRGQVRNSGKKSKNPEGERPAPERSGLLARLIGAECPSVLDLLRLHRHFHRMYDIRTRGPTSTETGTDRTETATGTSIRQHRDR